MTKVTIFVGLDYHQDSVQVCVMDRSGTVLANRNCDNDWRAIRGSDLALRGGATVANFGSRGASVHLELELDGGLVHDPDRLSDRSPWGCLVASRRG